MKKRISCCILLLCSILVVQAQEKFTIKGKLNGVKEPAKIKLSYWTDQGTVSDSTVLKNGAFAFKGTVHRPAQALLFISLSPGDRQNFYIEKGKITVTGNNLKEATIKGGKTQAENALLQSQLQPLFERVGQLREKTDQYSREKNETAKHEQNAQLMATWQEIRKL